MTTNNNSNLYYFHQKRYREISNNKSMIHEEEIIHGIKGFLFKYYLKENNKIDKFIGRYEGDNKYRLIYNVNDQRTEEIVTKDELMTKISKIKHLRFAYDYIKSYKDINEKEAVKRLKRSSKRKSKRSSK